MIWLMIEHSKYMIYSLYQISCNLLIYDDMYIIIRYDMNVFLCFPLYPHSVEPPCPSVIQPVAFIWQDLCFAFVAGAMKMRLLRSPITSRMRLEAWGLWVSRRRFHFRHGMKLWKRWKHWISEGDMTYWRGCCCSCVLIFSSDPASCDCESTFTGFASDRAICWACKIGDANRIFSQELYDVWLDMIW